MSQQHNLKAACSLVLLVFIATTVGLSRVGAQQKVGSEPLPEGAEHLPAGDGRAIMLRACVQCHDLRNTVSQRKTEDGWRRTINEMVWRSTPLVGNEAEIVTKYLARSFGLDKSEPDLVKKIFAGAKTGRELNAQGTVAARLDINAATAEELMTLPGVGSLEARAIIASREKSGAFKSADDLDRIAEIAPAVKRNLKKMITVATVTGAPDAPRENER